MRWRISEVVVSRAAIATRVDELARAIATDFPASDNSPPLWLVAALKGAAPFALDLARAIPRDVALGFARASSYGAATESSGAVRVDWIGDDAFAGADVVLVEDIVDTGRTANILLRALAERGPRRLKLAALLDKPSRRVEPVTIDYCGFEVPDRFLVGYGLDFDEHYRNLSDVRALEPGVAD
jgi:hypoxanthine phosphoribosyltransferase